MSHNARRTRSPKAARNQPSDWSPADESWLQSTLDMEDEAGYLDYDQANDHWLELIDEWRKESSNMLLDDFE